MTLSLGRLRIWLAPPLLLAALGVGLLAAFAGAGWTWSTVSGATALLAADLLSIGAFFLGRRLGFHQQSFREAISLKAPARRRDHGWRHGG